MTQTVTTPQAQQPEPKKYDGLLDNLQRDAFSYIYNEVNLQNGLLLDKTADNWPSSIAATGIALTAYPIAVERGYMERDEAIKRTLTTLRFFWNSTQSKAPNATGYKGFYYHFLNMNDGSRAWHSELSTSDSAFFLAGALTVAQYFEQDTEQENEIRKLADDLYRRADWQWAMNNGKTLTHGWMPESGFLQYRWEGYDEALLMYILGLGSPTHPLPDESYDAWGKTYIWKKLYDIEYLYAGPLFIHQLSHMWVDLRGVQDRYMRERDMDYFENSRRATLIQREYAIQNPQGFEGYCDTCWGITASDGPGPLTLKIKGVERRFYDYIARGVPYGPDDGTIAPWVVVASLPFAPEVVLPTIEYFVEHVHVKEQNPYGFKASFNPTYPDKSHSKFGWISPWHYGINQGPIVMMVENYRSGFLWNLMKKNPYILNGLHRAGFTGGWLA